MINSVRNAVLSVANKNNFGYITPDDFNLYAKQAQLDIFENYFYQYNNWIVKQNARLSGSGYSDVVRNIEIVIDSFSSTVPLVYSIPNTTFSLPSDYYYINNVRYNNNKEIDRVSQDKLINLLSSNLTAPSVMFPAYSMESNVIKVYPTSITTNVSSQYIRLPKDPKWTYTTIVGGSPLFDQTDPLYQDFELPESDEPLLVAKILQYAGMSIREVELYNFGTAEEIANKQIEG
jgi:hypothetical protein